MAELLADLTAMLNGVGTTTLYWIAGGILLLLLVLWLMYRVVRAAVRTAIKESGLVVSQPHLLRPRKPQDPKYDFVYTEPRSEH